MSLFLKLVLPDNDPEDILDLDWTDIKALYADYDIFNGHMVNFEQHHFKTKNVKAVLKKIEQDQIDLSDVLRYSLSMHYVAQWINKVLEVLKNQNSDILSSE